jgi:histidine phosphotransferase ChpT
MDLIRKSARQASAKLQFARLAFGAAGSAGAEIDLGDAHSVAAGFLANEKADIAWEVPRLLMAKNRVKLLLNLILLANQCVPRGGLITVSMTGEASNPTFELKVTGSTTKVPSLVLDLTSGREPERIDAHTVQPVYTILLARESGMNLEVIKQDDGVRITATAKD